ncbi:hypothetical protein RLIN73S_04788 [Rhodanobacter lindaniclasticus]
MPMRSVRRGRMLGLPHVDWAQLESEPKKPVTANKKGSQDACRARAPAGQRLHGG